ncbi:hypothetical protein K440DRAFT_634092 [Wilcoxina mikolae CBS 423.85]|nr:hypothetical protein K440DRAFT_634092 [Wilcoxina mikolae CBS 423.85]
MASPCCFGVVESSWVDSSGQLLPARTVTRRLPNTVMVERSSIPRSLIPPPPPPPAPAPEYINQLAIYPVFPSTPTTPTAIDTQAAANCIAEILAPLNIEHNREVMRHHRKSERREEESRARQAEIAILNEQNLEAEAIRRVRERNRRDDLQAMENNARLRIEYDFGRSSTSSVRSSNAGDYGSRDQLVIVSQSRDSADALRDHRCGNCHEFGHRSRDCKTTVTFSIPERRARRHSVSYVKVDPPRRQVRYVQGA